jgi:hypothetical protein
LVGKNILAIAGGIDMNSYSWIQITLNSVQKGED